MNTVKYIFLSLFICLNTTTIFSQRFSSKNSIVAEDSGRMHDLMKVLRHGNKNTQHTLKENYKGSPFMSETFSPTELIVNNKSVGVFMMRYNIYNDEFQVNDSEEPPYSTIIKANHVDIIHTDVLFKVYDYMNKSRTLLRGYFLTSVNNPNCTLLVKNGKKYKPGVASRNGFTKDFPAKFIDTKAYYLKFENDFAITSKLKNKEILKLFPDHKKLLKEFVDQNKINVKKETDLIKLINYYNSIDSENS